MRLTILLFVIFYVNFGYCRPLSSGTTESCDFHKYEEKQSSYIYPDISKSKVPMCKGQHKRLRELVGNLPPKDLHGAQNESQLILARAGLFPEGAIYASFESYTICEEHLIELYTGFDNSKHVLSKQNSITRKKEPACSYANKHTNKKVGGLAKLSFEESKAIFEQNNKLVIQTGIPLCKTDKEFAESELQKWNEANPPGRVIPAIPSEFFCEKDDPTDPDYEPSSSVKKRDDKCNALSHFAKLVGITRAISIRDFDEMTENTIYRKFLLGFKLFDKMAEVMAHDKKDDLKQHVCSKLLDYRPHSPSDMEFLLRNMSQLYLEAGDKTTKRHYLSYIAGIVPLSKIPQYLPGITRHMYDKAIEYSQKSPSDKPGPVKREKFDPVKVEYFINFITSDTVVTGLPFGTKTLKLSTTKLEIPSTLRLQKHGEISHKEAVLQSEPVDALKQREVEINLIEVETAIESIKKLQEHSLRSIHSDNYRKDVITQLDDKTALLTLDWAQKYLIDYYKQTQAAYFARRGISWSVTHALTRIDGELAEHTFIQIIENEKQDSIAVLAMLKEVLHKLKEQNIEKIVARMDNAGCYHSKEVLMSLKHIADETGIRILQWSFSEPQSGKGSSDRKAGRVKTALRNYIDKKNNIVTEADFFTALTSPKVLPFMSITRAKIDTSNSNPSDGESSKTTFPPIKQVYDFEVTDTSVIGRQANGIGNGLEIKFDKHSSLVQRQKLDILETKTSEIFWNKLKQAKKAANDDGMFPCPEETCTATFDSEADLTSHIEIGIHDIPKENLADHAMKHFKKRLEGMVEDQASLSKSNVVGASLSEFHGVDSILSHYPRGWALDDEKKAVKRFSDKQKEFMVQLFEQGLKNSKDMVRPEVAETMMKEAKDNDGQPRFAANELLTKQQLKSYFGQLSKKNKLKTIQQDDDINELRKAIYEEAKSLSN